MYGLTPKQELLWLKINNRELHQKILFQAELIGLGTRIVNNTLTKVVKYIFAHPNESLAEIYAGAFKLRLPDGRVPKDVIHKHNPFSGVSNCK